MIFSTEINELSAALAKAQGAMEAAKMGSVNPFLKNKYADLGSVIQAARAPLAANGLSFTQHPSVTETHVTVTTLLAHSSGQWITSEISLPLDGGKGLSLAQSMGAIITYLRRYTLSAILGIYADEDTDGNEGKTNKPQAKAKQETQAQAPPLPPMPDMDLETAMTVETNDGKPYHEIDSDTLAHMATSINKKLTAGGYKDDEVETAQFKLSAIKVILADRAEKAQE